MIKTPWKCWRKKAPRKTKIKKRDSFFSRNTFGTTRSSKPHQKWFFAGQWKWTNFCHGGLLAYQKMSATLIGLLRKFFNSNRPETQIFVGVGNINSNINRYLLSNYYYSLFSKASQYSNLRAIWNLGKVFVTGTFQQLENQARVGWLDTGNTLAVLLHSDKKIWPFDKFR